MTSQEAWPFAGLLQDGGAILVCIFILSIYLYASALKSLLATHAVASPLNRPLTKRSDLDALQSSSPFWNPVVQQLLGFDAERGVQYIKRRRKNFVQQIRSNLLQLKITVAAAPLLGLLGTIVGMVETFDAISAVQGRQTSSMVASGISKALLTTNAGLVVALPAVFLSFFIRRKLEQASLLFDTVESIFNQSKQAPES